MEADLISKNIKTYGTKKISLKNGSVKLCYLVECTNCKILHYKVQYELIRSIKRNKNIFCSRTCFGNFICQRLEVNCKNCNKLFVKRLNQIKQTNNNFCTQSCSATYTNTHKTKGTRRSKLEIWLEQQLIFLYPHLEIHFCRKDTADSELDIYIPSLKLAFELNGPVHYEPVYGIEKLIKIQNNDQKKIQSCLNKQIQIVIIDVSKFKYTVTKNFLPFLNIINTLIECKIKSNQVRIV